MSRNYKIVPTTAEPPLAKPPTDWTTGLCECAGQNACCFECCLVSTGLDFLLYKDTDECYIERQRGLKHDDTRTYMPDPNTLEAFIGTFCCRGMGVLLTCGLAAGTGGIFDLVWCYSLARQRRQVREMYRIEGSSCCDCLHACCCRCCMFNQLKHQLVADNPNPPSLTQQQVNSMRDQFPNRTWLVSNKTFRNPPNGPSPGNPSGREYL